MCRVNVLHVECALYPLALGDIYRVEFDLGVFGEAFVAMVGITAQDRTPLFYAFTNGISNIGLANPSKRGHAQVETGLPGSL